ncbi:MAG TPA: IPT/TIG domain-containing protein [Anaeromyxobacter sp.]|nr:IPT/TIG domain-containing protein [Anaeromyxobacter sp.]
MRRALALLAALAPLACSRDLALPDASAPRVEAIQLVGLEGSPAPVPLPVLGGELVAIRGAGLPADATQLEVRVGTEDAEVIEASAGRLVVRVPALGAIGPADVQLRTPNGFGTREDALRYDGPGAPEGFDTSDLRTAVPLAFVGPVQPPANGFPDIAIATGASDSALLVVPEVGLAAAAIPLGLVPASAAARVKQKLDGSAGIEVLALARGGDVVIAEAIYRDGVLVDRGTPRTLSHATVNPTACSFPQVTFTNDARPVAAWTAAGVPTGTVQWIAAIDDGKLGVGEYAPAALGAHAVAAPITAWAPWKTGAVVFAAGGEIWVYDVSTPAVPPRPLTALRGGVGAPQTISTLLAPCAGAGLTYLTLAAASVAGQDLLAVSFDGAGGDWVALVDLTPGAGEGSVRMGLAAGTLATSVALVPEPPYAPASWAVLTAGIGNLYRFRPAPAAPSCKDLVADAALQLSGEPGVLPAIGGMITTSGGTRLLATTPDLDLVTVLPPSLTSAGPVLRLASYGGVSMQVATLGGQALPVAVAEHAYTGDALSEFDVGSALLAVAMTGESDPVALGGSGYARGAVWLEPPSGGALAYTGDLPSLTHGAISERGGAAAVTSFAPGVCPGESVRIAGSRPVAGGPDLVAQGPARAGALGPAGLDRWGPAAAPIYAALDTSLAVYAPGPGNLSCLAGSAPNWDKTTGCPPDAEIALGVEPIDVTLSAGDRAVAVRRLDMDACAFTLALFDTCLASDLLCLRASCPPAKELRIARAGASPAVVALPARPAGVAADRGGGWLVTLPCEVSSFAGGDDCFPSSAVCDGLLTGPGGADGALLHVAEDGTIGGCLAVLSALAGPVAVTPNGAEAWVTGEAFRTQYLSRLALPRRASDGVLDASRRAARLAIEALGSAPRALGSFAGGGIAFTPEGGTAIVTVPGEYRIVLYR